MQIGQISQRHPRDHIDAWRIQAERTDMTVAQWVRATLGEALDDDLAEGLSTPRRTGRPREYARGDGRD